MPEQIYSPLLSSFEVLATSEAAHNEHDKDGGWDETNYGGDKNFPFSHWNLSDHVPLAMVKTKETMGPHHSITATTIITK